MHISEKDIEGYIRAYIIDGYNFNQHKKSDKEILGKYIEGWHIPSNSALYKNNVPKMVKEAIREGKVESQELGVWTPSFSSALKDSGCLNQINMHCFKMYYAHHKELYLDLHDIRAKKKISKMYGTGLIVINTRCFHEYVGKINNIEYIAGLFAGSRIIEINNQQWHFVKYGVSEMGKKTPDALKKVKDRMLGILDKISIPYKEHKNGIIISPFFGALFFGYMPIHSASRQINMDRAGECPVFPYIYWNMTKKKKEPLAPVKKWQLPYSKSYATHFNKKIYNNDWRKLGVDVGILGISEELREMILEWKKYHSYTECETNNMGDARNEDNIK